MALPQFPSLGRSILSRVSAQRIFTQNVASRRAFACSNRLFDASTVNSGENPSEEERNRSIALLRLPDKVSKAEVENVIKNAGFQITKSQLRFNRMTFLNDTNYFAELANEEQAKEAVQKFEGSSVFEGYSPIYAKILRQDFSWKSVSNFRDLWIYDEGSAASEAVLPLKEGRRIQLRIETPSWLPEFETKPEKLMTARKLHAYRLISEAFDRFGVERMGPPAAIDGRRLREPKFFCHIDFKTKDGAEAAIREMHDTKLEGKLIWVAKAQLNEVRSRQIGRVNMGVLKELQELGLAPKVDWNKK